VSQELRNTEKFALVALEGPAWSEASVGLLLVKPESSRRKLAIHTKSQRMALLLGD
jgi:hypothetical protein